MIQALTAMLARLSIWVVGLHTMALEVKRAKAVGDARRSVIQAVGTMDEFGDGEAEAIEARGLGFAEYGNVECECDEEGSE